MRDWIVKLLIYGVLVLAAACTVGLETDSETDFRFESRCEENLEEDSADIIQARLNPSHTIIEVGVATSREEEVRFVSALVAERSASPDASASIGTWAVLDAQSGPQVLAVDDVAKELSGWPAVSQGDADGISLETEGAAISRECARGTGAKMLTPVPSVPSTTK